MTSWATVVLTIGVGILGIAGGVLIGGIERRHARQLRLEEGRERRIGEAAEIIARLDLLLADSDPQRLGINVDPNDPFRMYKPLEAEWRSDLRPRLAAYALAHPSSDVRALGEQLVSAVWNSVTSAGWHLRALTPSGSAGPDGYEQARIDHAEARRLSGEFMAVVRGDSANR